MVRGAWPVALATLLGAALTFTLEPIVGRLVTAHFGGAMHVWTVCLMTYQGLLFLGYLWAWTVARRLGGWHLLLLALGAFWLPLGFESEIRPEAPVLALVFELLTDIGPPFALLTTTAVVTQQWWTQSKALGHHDPYVLYAASNAGSLGALLAYPFLIEPHVDLWVQRWVWSASYLGFAAVMVGAYASLRKEGWVDRLPEVALPSARDALWWVSLAAVPSSLLLAVTNLVTSEMGSFPLVWTVPLAMYLGTFIFAFRPHDDRPASLDLWPDVLLATALLASLAILPVILGLLFLSFALVCWLLHDELYRRRPHPVQLGPYYVAIAAGGWAGGAFVALAAPVLFADIFEFYGGLVAAGGLLWASVGWPKLSWWREVHFRYSVSRGVLTPLMIVLLANLALARKDRNFLHTERSLYGVFHVAELETTNGERYRELSSGVTMHGVQYLDPSRAGTPMGYYHPDGPNAGGLALRQGGRVAGIGLGSGAIAGLMNEGEHLTFYEINPSVERLARTWFTYLDRSNAEIEVRIGDARLLMKTEGTDDYDAIFVDAFSGDGIPIHLITAEAIRLYFDRLTADGVLVLHVSNRYYDLRGVLKTISDHLDVHGAERLSFPDPDEPLHMSATAVVLARTEERLVPLVDAGWGLLDDLEGLPLWTDERTNMLAALRAKANE